MLKSWAIKCEIHPKNKWMTFFQRFQTVILRFVIMRNPAIPHIFSDAFEMVNDKLKIIFKVKGNCQKREQSHSQTRLKTMRTKMSVI